MSTVSTRKALTAAAALSIALSVAGCDGDESSAAASSGCLADANRPFVAAVGARANSPVPQMPAAAQTLLNTSAKARQKVTLIRVDGDPEVVFDKTFTPAGGNDVAVNDEFGDFAAAVQAAFNKELKAETAEADPLTALTLAARSVPNGGNIVLLDSGLQTVEPLRFQDDNGALFAAEPKDVVDLLRKRDLLPDLAGSHVLLAGLGNVVEPQAGLDQRLHKRVIAMWTAIAEAGGACVEVADAPDAVHEATDDVPDVTAVPLPKPPPPPPACGETVLNDRNDVGFVADQAVFLDEQAARATIGKIASLMADGRQRAELVGTTADVGSFDGQVGLSKQRADAVRKVLEDLGVEPSRLTTQGLGSKFPGYQTDHGAQGELLPGPAANNRKVLVDLSCDNN
jgi:outer membrane protein OmpA-like peptidoglycan-associated protein